MLPKSERLRKNSEFSAVYNLKRSVSNSLFILYTGKIKTSADIPPKAGFVVGKKVYKQATRRNYLKRLMREAYKNAEKSSNIEVNRWESLIFIARPGIVEVNYEQVYDGIVDCLKKAARKYGNPEFTRK